MEQPGISGSFINVTQGTTDVGNGTVQLSSDTDPCRGILIMAPTSDHTSGVNTSRILVGYSPTGNVSGGWSLETDDYAGKLIFPNSPSMVYLTGFSAGDSVEYQIFR